MCVRAGLLAFVTLVVAGACKDKQAATPAPPAPAPPAATTPPTSDAGAATDRPQPSAPTEAKPALGSPLSIEDAAKVIPALDGKEILPLRQTSDKRQVHATWCLDGEGADEVARSVGRQMAAAGYRNLAIRGDARKAGVQGERDGFQLSMVVSASSAANCPAPKHYFASATIFRQP